MNALHFLTLFLLGAASAHVMKRQASSPPDPTNPPTMPAAPASLAPSSSDAPAMGSTTPDAPTSAPIGSTSDAMPAMSSTPMGVVTGGMGGVTDMGTQTMMPSAQITTADSVTSDVSSGNSDASTASMDTTMGTSAPTTMQTTPTVPTTTTTKKPTIDELVSVDEIVDVFDNVATSDYFRKLAFEDQLLVMEILAGGETGKMTAIIDQVETKHLLRFMYNLPYKYADPLWRVINLGYTREELIA